MKEQEKIRLHHIMEPASILIQRDKNISRLNLFSTVLSLSVILYFIFGSRILDAITTEAFTFGSVVLVLLMVFIVLSIIAFFEGCITYQMKEHVSKEEPELMESIRFTAEHVLHIVGWVFLSFIIGPFIRLFYITISEKRRKKMGLFGIIISSLRNARHLVIPAMIFNNLNLADSMKKALLIQSVAKKDNKIRHYDAGRMRYPLIFCSVLLIGPAFLELSRGVVLHNAFVFGLILSCIAFASYMTTVSAVFNTAFFSLADSNVMVKEYDKILKIKKKK